MKAKQYNSTNRQAKMALRIGTADSTSKRNGGGDKVCCQFEGLADEVDQRIWGVKSEDFSRTVVELFLGGSVFGHGCMNGRLFWVIFTQQSDGVFDRALLPSMIGVAEECRCAGNCRYAFVVGKFHSIVVGDGKSVKRLERLFDRIAHQQRCFPCDVPDDHVARFAFDEHEQCASEVSRALHEVSLPVSELAAIIDFSRSGTDAGTVSDNRIPGRTTDVSFAFAPQKLSQAEP